MPISDGHRRNASGSRRARRPLLLAAALVLLGTAAAAPALQPPAPDVGAGGWWMGLGYLRYQRPYIGNGHWNRIVPLFSIDTPHFYVHGLKFGWRAWQRGANTFELVARPDALRYNPVANGALAGMSTKLATVMGGAAWVWRFDDHLALDTEALTDLLRRNDGEVLSVALTGRWENGAWFLQPRAGIDWDSGNYVDYYFGVTPAEARPGRPAYSGKGTVSESVGFSFGRTFAWHFAALAGVYATHFGSGITASPIVAHANSTSFLLALYYRF